jgi:hypothetical protein
MKSILLGLVFITSAFAMSFDTHNGKVEYINSVLTATQIDLEKSDLKCSVIYNGSVLASHIDDLPLDTIQTSVAEDSIIEVNLENDLNEIFISIKRNERSVYEFTIITDSRYEHVKSIYLNTYRLRPSLVNLGTIVEPRIEEITLKDVELAYSCE